ncbi:unnamed protein product [Strongylus vulgaris]|uniref:LIM zinc-binding domain-containing protein n=1 Tax=Strongylus vulgaris TaxID=40348 RepID=A0A3P7L5Y1_STRVU|nr:unnamed protein product [Strongylus vulgaris]
MSKLLKVHTEWLDSIGYSPYVWLRGDWHQPLHLLSKLLAVQLQERSHSVIFVVFVPKLSLSEGHPTLMLQLAEETLGIPCLITEKDLMIKYPNIMLAMLVYLICVKHSVDFIDPKSLRHVVAPKLVFEARNGGDAQFPRCASCHEHIKTQNYFKIIVEAIVWHRQCFKCVECNAPMRAGGFKKGKRGYECVIHAIRRILDAAEEKKTFRPKIAPPAAPSPSPSSVGMKREAENSVPPPISPKPRLPSGGKTKPLPPPKPARFSSSKESKLVQDETRKEMKAREYEEVSIESENSGDSGIVVKAQNLYVDTDSEGYQFVGVTASAPLLTLSTEASVPDSHHLGIRFAFNSSATPSSLLPGESDRPKCTPPPPPQLTASISPEEIMFTDHKTLGDTIDIASKLESLDEELSKIVREGKQLEVEMLFLITQNPSGWLKMPRTEEFIAVMCRFLDKLKESCFLQYMWREAFLNEIHSETEYHLRCIVEKETQDSKHISSLLYLY